jgi:hypothetical protein
LKYRWHGVDHNDALLKLPQSLPNHQETRQPVHNRVSTQDLLTTARLQYLARMTHDPLLLEAVKQTQRNPKITEKAYTLLPHTSQLLNHSKSDVTAQQMSTFIGNAVQHHLHNFVVENFNILSTVSVYSSNQGVIDSAIEVGSAAYTLNKDNDIAQSYAYAQLFKHCVELAGSLATDACILLANNFTYENAQLLVQGTWNAACAAGRGTVHGAVRSVEGFINLGILGVHALKTINKYRALLDNMALGDEKAAQQFIHDMDLLVTTVGTVSRHVGNIATDLWHLIELDIRETKLRESVARGETNPTLLAEFLQEHAHDPVGPYLNPLVEAAVEKYQELAKHHPAELAAQLITEVVLSAKIPHLVGKGFKIAVPMLADTVAALRRNPIVHAVDATGTSTGIRAIGASVAEESGLWARSLTIATQTTEMALEAERLANAQAARKSLAISSSAAYQSPALKYTPLTENIGSTKFLPAVVETGNAITTIEKEALASLTRDFTPEAQKRCARVLERWAENHQTIVNHPQTAAIAELMRGHYPDIRTIAELINRFDNKCIKNLLAQIEDPSGMLKKFITNTMRSIKNNLDHLFSPKIAKKKVDGILKDSVSGFHHDYQGNIQKTTNFMRNIQEFENGFYKCEMLEELKSFFPKHLTPSEVMELIYNSIENGIKEGNYKFSGVRLRIEGIVNGTTIVTVIDFARDELITAHPLLTR